MSRSTTTVLVVEDCQPTNRLLQSILEQCGLKVCVAETVLHALEMLRTLRPDLVLLDVILPDGSGFDIVRKLRQEPGTSSIPIIVLSGMTDELLQEEASERGCSDFLPKPFKLYDLAWRIQRWLPDGQKIYPAS